MILVDTSVWVDHLREGDGPLSARLERGQVLVHPLETSVAAGRFLKVVWADLATAATRSALTLYPAVPARKLPLSTPQPVQPHDPRPANRRQLG